MTNSILKILNLFKNLVNKLYTLFYLAKYSFFIHTEGKTIIHKGFKLVSFSDKTSKLRINLNKNSRIKFDVIIQGKGTLTLGENSYISHRTIIGVNESITIGKNVMIAANVSIRDTDHNFDNLTVPMMKQGIKTAPIIIEDNVWIGHGAVINKGITIESGAIIGSNAVVTKNVAKNSIVGGIPAKVIKSRK